MEPRFCDFAHLTALGFVRVGYVEWGPAQGATVICAHGLTRNARDFDPLAAALAARGWRVAAVDFPGRGRSERLARAEDYAYPTYLGALAALIARLDVERVSWIGTSMGGLAGMMLAAQPRAPIARLVVNDVGPFIPKAALERIADYVGADVAFDSPAAAESHLRRIAAPFGPLDDAHWRHLATHSFAPGADGRLRFAYDPRIGEALRARPIADVDLWPLWDRIACPTLALRGALSDLLLPSTAAEMARRGPRARVVEIADCGHAPALMSAAQIAIVADFLAEDDARR